MKPAEYDVRCTASRAESFLENRRENEKPSARLFSAKHGIAVISGFKNYNSIVHVL
jgi:hypothetical protein